MYRSIAHATTRSAFAPPPLAAHRPKRSSGTASPAGFLGLPVRFKATAVRRVVRPPASNRNPSASAAPAQQVRAPSAIFPAHEADDSLEAATANGDPETPNGGQGGEQVIQVTAAELFPPDSMIKLWQSRPPSTAGVPLKVSSNGLKEIVAKLDRLLEGKTVSEVVDGLGKEGLDGQCNELRAFHTDERQWSVVAQLLLAHNSFNVHRSYLLYELARHAGDFTAEYAVARMYLKDKSPAKLAAAKSLLTSLATRGHPQAQLTLGGLYAADPATSSKALSLFSTAAANGLRIAYVEAGRLHLHLNEPDLARAQFTLAARAGEPKGHFYLAQMCAKENKDDWPSLVEHLTRAAEGGVPEAQHNLGMMYLQGRPAVGEGGKRLPKDVKRAKQWLELAAARGFWPSMFNLALVLRSEGGAEQTRRARELLVKCTKVSGKFGDEAKRELEKLDRRGRKVDVKVARGV
ncbi:hypothetical protein BCR44DRAFT_1513235 [Catenaria anguillulae PL171]|uniref:HCP-like protein n=1 Tax=Catenaria anguillulae PL171 TaxID=765915 RepID=A0A1Y2HQR8_9FUNG|nr:hypothetical protein BCR44DRAFT_1513235 [Catenaria anguillulae PL171]